MDKQKTCFPPVLGKDPKILVLGSMPGEKSLHEQQYYAHPRNAFWFIMQELFNIPVDQPYKQRLEKLKLSGVALWDVLNSCEREGSLDVAIQKDSIVVNDFESLFQRYNSIQLIVFNGAKAETEFLRRVLPKLSKAAQQIEKARLPSTSPAMASLTKEEKLETWKERFSSIVSPHKAYGKTR